MTLFCFFCFISITNRRNSFVVVAAVDVVVIVVVVIVVVVIVVVVVVVASPSDYRLIKIVQFRVRMSNLDDILSNL